MLIIEKEDDTQTLKSIGANDKLIERIFLFEGWMISLLGMFAGIVLGSIISLIQQHFGVVDMPGNFVMEAYPVVLKFWDIVAVATGVSLIGYIASMLPVKNFRKKQQIIKY